MTGLLLFGHRKRKGQPSKDMTSDLGLLGLEDALDDLLLLDEESPDNTGGEEEKEKDEY